jgi:pilus assembly protein CpaB
MSMRTILVLVLALVCGGTAAIGISALLRPAPAAAAPEKEPELVPVVVSAMDLGRFTTLTPEVVKVRMIAKDSAHPDSIAKAEDVLDRTLLNPVVKGEAILEKKLAAKGSGRGMETAIPAGMRAVTVLTQNQAAGVAGFVLPGSKVDVLLTMSLPTSINDASAGTPKTFVLLEDVEVLASQKYVQNPENNQMNVGDLQYVTLLVNQEQAKMVSLSQNRSGQLQMVLRNPNDKTAVSRKVLTLPDLEPESSRPKPAPAAPEQVPVEKVAQPKPDPRPGQIRIIRGLSESIVPVEPAIVREQRVED